MLPPIKTPLGWHVIQVLDKKAPQTKKLAAVKKEIKSTLKEESLADALFALSEEIDDALAGGEPLATIAQSYNLKLHETESVNAGGISQKGKAAFEHLEGAMDLLSEGFDLAEEETSQLIPAGINRF